MIDFTISDIGKSKIGKNEILFLSQKLGLKSFIFIYQYIFLFP